MTPYSIQPGTRVRVRCPWWAFWKRREAGVVDRVVEPGTGVITKMGCCPEDIQVSYAGGAWVRLDCGLTVFYEFEQLERVVGP